MNRRFIMLLAVLMSCTTLYAVVVQPEFAKDAWTGPASWDAIDPVFTITNNSKIIDPGFFVTNGVIRDPGFYVDSIATNYPSVPIDIEQHRLNKCEWCSTRDTSILAVRHVVPAAAWKQDMGLYDGIENLATLCDTCNFVVLHRCNYRAPAMVNFRKVLEASK